MRTFWASTGWFAALWIVYIAVAGMHAFALVAIGCALFFACLFLTDLFDEQRPAMFVVFLSGALLTALMTSWLLTAQWPGVFHRLFQLFLASMLLVRAANKLPGVWMTVFGAATGIMVLVSTWLTYGFADALWLFLLLYMVGFAALLKTVFTLRDNERLVSEQYEAVLDEYRMLKRQAKLNEEAVRAEERTQITRQIHDSVGHKLTSLLMQIEMFRMQAEGKDKEQAEQMKRLAQASLNETRNAVKALQAEEVSGMQALLRLVRNLETENYMQIDFNVRHGALSVLLDNDQSIALYRAFQEALTNAMRHGSSRMVKILLESPGGRVFRFEIVNETEGQDAETFTEGFGLTSMRERIENAGGTLEIIHTNQQFIVRGSFLL